MRGFVFFSCLFLVVSLSLLFYPPINKRIKRTSFYKFFKTTENSLIEDDAQQYENAKSNNWLRKLNVVKEEKNKPIKDEENPRNDSASEYDEKDRDYLDGLIKKRK